MGLVIAKTVTGEGVWGMKVRAISDTGAQSFQWRREPVSFLPCVFSFICVCFLVSVNGNGICCLYFLHAMRK